MTACHITHGVTAMLHPEVRVTQEAVLLRMGLHKVTAAFDFDEEFHGHIGGA